MFGFLGCDMRILTTDHAYSVWVMHAQTIPLGKQYCAQSKYQATGKV